MIVIIPDPALSVEVVTPGAVLEVKRVVGGGSPPTERRFVVAIVVRLADESSAEAAVVGKEKVVSVVGVSVLVCTSVVGVAAGLAGVCSGGNSAGVTIPSGSSGGGSGGSPLSLSSGPRSCFGMLDGSGTRVDVMATSEGAVGSVFAS